MTKDVQQQGGPYTEQNVFIGLPRQLTIDSTNWRILLHDGETPGGHMFIPRNEQDERYQTKSDELNGLLGFQPQAKGFLARTGLGSYVLRSLEFSLAFEIIHADGFAGNPQVDLAASIPNDIVWTGAHIFANQVQTDTQGTHTGPTNGTHTGPVNGDVVGNLQGNSEGNHLGGLDARGAATFFDADQIPPAAIAGLLSALAAIPGALPTGIIVDWYGTVDNVPVGWFLCDGTNGTPDLRNRFIVGTGSDFDNHSTGGFLTKIPGGTLEAAGVHSHTAEAAGHAITIAEMPAHYHGSGVCDTVSSRAFNHGTIAAAPAAADNIQSDSGTVGGYEAKSTSVGTDATHTHTLTVDVSNDHTHVFGGIEASYLPPYYALCKIMKA